MTHHARSHHVHVDGSQTSGKRLSRLERRCIIDPPKILISKIFFCIITSFCPTRHSITLTRQHPVRRLRSFEHRSSAVQLRCVGCRVWWTAPSHLGVSSLK